MNVSRTKLWLLAIVVGVLLVPVRLVVAFFPFFNIAEVLLFGGICFLLAWVFKAKSWVWALLLAAPVCLYLLRILNRLGFERLTQGTGTGHAVSLILIPLAAVLGAMLGIKLVWRRSGFSPSPKRS